MSTEANNKNKQMLSSSIHVSVLHLSVQKHLSNGQLPRKSILFGQIPGYPQPPLVEFGRVALNFGRVTIVSYSSKGRVHLIFSSTTVVTGIRGVIFLLFHK